MAAGLTSVNAHVLERQLEVRNVWPQPLLSKHFACHHVDGKQHLLTQRQNQWAEGRNVGLERLTCGQQTKQNSGAQQGQ